MSRPIRQSRWSVVRHLGGGLYYAIPLCCTLEFCLLFFLRPDVPTAVVVGCRRENGCRADYVHCWYHRQTLHGKPSPGMTAFKLLGQSLLLASGIALWVWVVFLAGVILGL